MQRIYLVRWLIFGNRKRRMMDLLIILNQQKEISRLAIWMEIGLILNLRLLAITNLLVVQLVQDLLLSVAME